MRSSGGVIQRSSFRGNLVAKGPAQVTQCPQIDGPADQRPHIELELGYSQQARRAVGLELDEKVDVAVRTQLAPQRGAEEAKASDAVDGTEGLQAIVRDGDARGKFHHTNPGRLSTRRLDHILEPHISVGPNVMLLRGSESGYPRFASPVCQGDVRHLL